MEDLKIKSKEKISRKSKIGMLVMCMIVMITMTNPIFGVTYLYEAGTPVDSFIEQSSVVSTVATPTFNFQSVSQVLMEPTTGKVLYAHNEHEKLLPASVTKIMSMLLIMEQIDSGKMQYTDMITCSAKASKMGGSQIWFKEGEQLSVEDALKAIAVVSANDVVLSMSEHIAGSEENFVQMMNAKAEALGMKNTHFMNPHGIDEENHYTTAFDIALMSRELITKHPDVLKFTSIWMDSIRNGTFNLSNTNKLIRFYDGATGLKTGSTSQALFNLAATATRNNTTFLSVVMKAPSSDIRAEESKQLLDYGFSNYEVKKIWDSQKVIDTVKINKNVEKQIQLVGKQDITALIEKGSKIETEEKVTINTQLCAPLEANTVVGTIEIVNKADGSIIGQSDIVIKEKVDKSSITEYLKNIFSLYILRQK